MATRCIAACVGKIRLQGWIDDPQSPVYYLVLVAKVALPLYPQFGTEPNVYYIPPVHVPPRFLRQMFGHGVEEAIALYRRAADDKKLLGALLLFGSTPEIIHHYKLMGSHAVGFGEKGVELVRVPLSEPIHIREAYDARHDAFRTNVT